NLSEPSQGQCTPTPHVAIDQIDRPIAPQEYVKKSPKPNTIPPPYTLMKTLCVGELAHELEVLQPCLQWVGLGTTRPRRVVRNRVLPYVKTGTERSDLVVKVAHQIRISIRETGSSSCEAAFGDEVRDQPHLTKLKTGISAKTSDSSWNRDLVPHHNVMQWLPAAYRQKRMVPSDFDRSTRAGRDLEAWLDAAVNPGFDIVSFDAPIRCETVDLRDLSPDCFFDRNALTG